jgi:hypothetical protein
MQAASRLPRLYPFGRAGGGEVEARAAGRDAGPGRVVARVTGPLMIKRILFASDFSTITERAQQYALVYLGTTTHKVFFAVDVPLLVVPHK